MSAVYKHARDPQYSNEYSILLVDDDETDRDLCKRFLARQPHYSYQFREARNGDEARYQIEQQTPDCVLIDRYLDNEDGCVLMSELHEKYPFLPTIILTGDGSGSTALTALRGGAADYLVKSSLSTEALHRCVQNAVEKARLSVSLERQRRQLNYSYGMLVQQHEVLSHYYHTVTHELKNPLASCKEFLNILQDNIAGPINSEQHELLTIANRSCERMSEFLDDLFEASGIDTDKIRLNIEASKIKLLIMDAVSDYREIDTGKSKQVEIVIEQEHDLSVLVDRVRIRRAITKILIAAENNVLVDEPVRVHLAEQKFNESHITLEISYAGIETSENNLLHFSTQRHLKQSHDESTDYNVLGLDILFCKKVIELHKGVFSFDRHSNLGGVFTVQLPVANRA